MFIKKTMPILFISLLVMMTPCHIKSMDSKINSMRTLSNQLVRGSGATIAIAGVSYATLCAAYATKLIYDRYQAKNASETQEASDKQWTALGHGGMALGAATLGWCVANTKDIFTMVHIDIVALISLILQSRRS